MDESSHPTRRALLDRLLCELFPNNDELRRFLAYYEVDGLPLGEELVEALPDPSVPRPRYAFEAATAIEARGLVTDTFTRALMLRRPGKAQAIEDFAIAVADASVRAMAPARNDRPDGPEAERADAVQRVVLTDSKPNPFAPFRSFVGRNREIEAVSARLSQGTSVLLIGGRRAGKTALIRKLDEGRVGRRIVRLDVAAWEPVDEADALVAMGKALGRTDEQARRTREDVERALDEHTARAPLAMVIDEADRLLGRPWTGTFLAWLRYLDDTRLGHRIAFVLVGGPSLARYENPDDRGSPPLNTSDPVYLDPLDPAARRELASAGREYVDETWLWQAVGGHPWLLTRVLERMWEGAELQVAMRAVFQAAQSSLRTWRLQAGEDGLALLRRIPGEGIEESRFDYDGDLAGHVQALLTLRCLCLVEVRDGRIHRGPQMVLQPWLQGGGG